jgi:hypothetical protein
LKLAILATNILICAIVLEFAFRAYSGVTFSLQDFRSQRILAVERGPYIEYDPLLGWKYVDHYSNDKPPFPLSTIEYGIRRNSSADSNIRSGGALVVGDSFTMGAFVADDETWPAQLERLLGIPVLNAAVASYGIDTNVLRAEQLLPIVKPKLLIVGSTQGVYLLSFTSFNWSKPYFTMDDKGTLRLRNNPVPLPGHDRDKVSIAKRIFSYSYVVDYLMNRFAPLVWLSAADRQFKEIPTDKVHLACALLRRLKNDAEHFGARAILVLQHGADADMAKETDEQIAVAACAKQLGFMVIDEYQTIHAILQSNSMTIEELYLREDGLWGHMTPKGNRLIAEIVGDVLTKEGY